MPTFETLKASALSSLSKENDKSPKNSVDPLFLPLITRLNESPCYFTTSSCSGRVVLSSHSAQKGKGFDFVSHVVVPEDKLLQYFDGSQENVDLRYDPPVLHVTASEMSTALSVLHAAISQAGWKDSGMIPSLSFSTDKPVRIALRLAPRHLDVPLVLGGVQLVTKDALKVLTQEANRRLEEGWVKIERLHSALVESVLEGKKKEGKEWEDKESRRLRKREEGLLASLNRHERKADTFLNDNFGDSSV